MAIQLKKAKADPSSRYVQSDTFFNVICMVEVLVYPFYKEKNKAYFLFVARY